MSLLADDRSVGQLSDAVREGLARARQWLLDEQDASGFWRGVLETNVTMDAEDLMLRQFLGVLDPKDATTAGNWIRANQRDDGTWANFYGGPGDLSTTVEAYVALRLCGDKPTDTHMARASHWIVEHGGLEKGRVFTRFWLALFGLWSWDDLPAVPPELIFLPPSVPLNIYDFGCWARQTVVAISVVFAYRPARPLAFGLEELRANELIVREPRSLASWRGRFLLLDGLLHRYERFARRSLPRKTFRELALRNCERWIVSHQEADGGWGGIQPPWVYSILALHLRGYRLDHPVMTKTFEGLESFLVRQGDQRWLEACQSPVWDSALATIALVDAGLDPAHPSLGLVGKWLLDQEVRDRGDWAVTKPDVSSGGWAFEFANVNYPDVDDTAEVILALRRVETALAPDLDAAVRRGIEWIKGMVSENGAWGAFDADNLREILYELPFCDFGAVIDPPSVDVTAHVVEMLAAERDIESSLIARGVRYLLNEQEHDGSWYGRWGVNYVYGTGAAIPALVAAGLGEDPAIRRGLHFLQAHQNPDGGWGEDIRSYDDPSLAGFGGVDAITNRVWALLAYIAAGHADAPEARAGVSYLLSTQLESGTWDEPYYTGTGFPRFFYINYHLYRHVFPLSALGRWCTATGIAR